MNYLINFRHPDNLWMSNFFTMENWLPVPGFEGLYEVSDLGNFRTLGGRVGNWNRRLLKFKVMKDKYLYVRLNRNGYQEFFNAHRLVAKVFIPNPENKKEVNHKNSDRQDNRVENLEWVTPLENMRHALSKNGEWRLGRGGIGSSRTQEVSVCHPPLPAVGSKNQCKKCYMVDYYKKYSERYKQQRRERWLLLKK